MKQIDNILEDCIIPDGTIVEHGVTFGPRVVLAGEGIVIRANARIGAASVIGEKVTIGQGACVQPGAVVLRSIPANSIAEGNPAQVVGYVRKTSAQGTRSSAPLHLETYSFADSPRPGRIPLNVGKSELYLMRRVTDVRGSLTVGEMPSEVPFSPERYFAVFGVPSVELRGEHAHKLCEQFLICIHGSCRILLDDGEQRCEVTLDRPDIGVYMPAMIWGTQYRYSPDAVLLVFASHPYEASDYLRTYAEFLAELERRKA